MKSSSAKYLLFFLTMFLISCSDSGVSLQEGVYELSSYTENTESCDAEGASILENEAETLYTLRSGSFLGYNYLSFVSCADTADCQATKTEIDDGTLFAGVGTFTFDSGSNSTGRTGQTVTTGASGLNGDTCTDGKLEDHKLSINEDGSIMITTKVTYVDDYAEDDDGFCTTDGAKAAVGDNVCSEYQVLNATLIESF